MNSPIVKINLFLFEDLSTKVKIFPQGFKLLERAPGVTVEHIIASTKGKLIVEGDIPEMIID